MTPCPWVNGISVEYSKLKKILLQLKNLLESRRRECIAVVLSRRNAPCIGNNQNTKKNVKNFS